MPNQKLENLLNLSLEVSPQERARSQELETGYLPEEKSWELIVKYSGNLDAVRELGVQVEEMRNEYAILVVPEALIDQVSALPQIEYVEKPKRLFFAVNRAKAASCVNILQEPPRNLTGKGVLIAVLDSGIDYFHEDFRNADGTTRIVELWDQTLNQVFTREEINAALEAGDRAAARGLVPSVDGSGHGTSVAGIAAGNGRESDGAYRGVAYESEFLVVKLGNAREEGFPRTTELMRAVNFVVEWAVDRAMPLVVNISFGNTYGSHDGTGLLEMFLDDIGNYGRTTIVVGSGNEGAAAGHMSGNLPVTGGRGGGNAVQGAAAPGTGIAGGSSNGGSLAAGGAVQAELSVAPYESGVSVQLWKAYSDQFTVSLQTPSGEMLGPLSEQLGPVRFRYRGMQVLVYYGKPGPFSVAQEIYFDFVPDEGNYVESGIWTFRLQPQRVVQGQVDFWLPSAAVLNFSTRFLEPAPDITLTVPSTAAKVITVGAYNSATNSYADFSGRGFTRMTNQVKPDLCAPGVGLMAPGNGGGYRSVTGTSFAAPVVAGSAALLMQWGIVDGNDPFLYGEKVKAYLRRGARPLPGFGEFPNPQVGWGSICLRDSLPV
ncbi:peptidase S8 [Clostridiaceae bacterium]|nr:peptidase S8 [Clostridiaceae bacterium]RKI11663.1 peptidase S8 [bacterium 1XD21-70]